MAEPWDTIREIGEAHEREEKSRQIRQVDLLAGWMERYFNPDNWDITRLRVRACYILLELSYTQAIKWVEGNFPGKEAR